MLDKCTPNFDCMGLQYTFAFMVEGNASLIICNYA